MMARSMLGVTSSAYISTTPFALRAARPMVCIKLVSLRRKPSLSASRIAINDTSGRSRPSQQIDADDNVDRADAQVFDDFHPLEDLLGEIRTRIARGERALVTTLSVKMAEDLTDYL